MDIFKHPSCNSVIGPPSDMLDTCSSLPVLQYGDSDGIWSASFWKPGPEELQALIDGGSVMVSLRTAGRQHPVMMVAAGMPV